MTQTAIPYLFMRGGTSRGPYFNRADLPEDLDDLAGVLVAVVGSGHPLNIDGIKPHPCHNRRRTGAPTAFTMTQGGPFWIARHPIVNFPAKAVARFMHHAT
jgi:hypothetical protein